MRYHATILVACGLVIASCTSPTAAPSPIATGAVQSAGRVQPTGTVTVAVSDFSKQTFDPSLDGGLGHIMYGEVFDWWVGAAPDGKVDFQYGVLQSMTPNADNSVWTLTLKKGIHWQDGQEMTSEDTKWSLEYYARPDSSCNICGILRKNLASADNSDRYTTVVRLKRPDVNLLSEFDPLDGDVHPLPKHYFDAVGTTVFARQPMGSGPWKLASFVSGQSIEWEANVNYWLPAWIPRFARLKILLVPDITTRVAMLRRGEADLIAADANTVRDLGKAGFKIFGPKNTGSAMIVFWGSSDPAELTHSLQFRKALALGIDYESLFSAFYSAESQTRSGVGSPLFYPGTPGYDPTLKPYTFQPAEAAAALKQSGYAGQQITYWDYALTYNPEQREVNEVIASDWRKIGVNVTLSPIQFAQMRSKAVAEPQTFQPPANIGVNIPPGNPLRNLQTWMLGHKDGGVFSVYWNPDKIAPIFLKLSAVVDPQARDAQLRQLGRDLYDEYWAIPLGVVNIPFAAGPRLSSWKPTDLSLNDYAFQTLTPTH